MVPFGVRKHTEVFIQPRHTRKENFESMGVRVEVTSGGEAGECFGCLVDLYLHSDEKNSTQEKKNNTARICRFIHQKRSVFGEVDIFYVNRLDVPDMLPPKRTYNLLDLHAFSLLF